MRSSIQDIESSTTEVLQSLNESAQQCRRDCEEKIRNAPIPSVICAVGIGYVLRMLPLMVLVAGLARVALALIRPAIILFGAAKLIEFVKAECARSSSTAPTGPAESNTREPLLDSPVGPPPPAG